MHLRFIKGAPGAGGAAAVPARAASPAGAPWGCG